MNITLTYLNSVAHLEGNRLIKLFGWIDARAQVPIWSQGRMPHWHLQPMPYFSYPVLCDVVVQCQKLKDTCYVPHLQSLHSFDYYLSETCIYSRFFLIEKCHFVAKMLYVVFPLRCTAVHNAGLAVRYGAGTTHLGKFCISRFASI